MCITAVYKPVGSSCSDEYYYGDFNDDKIVDSIDFALLRMELLGITHTNSNNEDATFQKRVDVNGDSKINSVDFAYLKKKLLGKISEFPLGIKFKD
jgi:rhamnogalacturonan endolyase